jgi:hypothetical protein
MPIIAMRSPSTAGIHVTFPSLITNTPAGLTPLRTLVTGMTVAPSAVSYG